MIPPNPLSHVLDYLTETPQFLDPKLLGSIREIMAKVMGTYPSPELVLSAIKALHNAEYVEVASVNEVIKTIRKKKDGIKNK